MMAATSKIEWCDSTVNFWWGCTKVGPGCDHCYAETQARRFGGEHWGVGVPRRKIKGAVKLLLRLNNDYSEWAADHAVARGNAAAFGLPAPLTGLTRRVFIQSMSDLFDNEVRLEWFGEAWTTIQRCDRLHIQIVTKRISVVEKRLAAIGVTKWPKHVGLMITVCNQAEAERDIPRLLSLKAKLGIPWVGLSIEPLLGPVSLVDWDPIKVMTGKDAEPQHRFYVSPLKGWGLGPHAVPRLDWVIVGGESGRNARPMHPDWARSLRDQCKAAGVPFFFKQWGEWLPIGQHDANNQVNNIVQSSNLEFNNSAWRVGKARAGRLLDGNEHNAFPEALT
jgi:protein gp37